MTQPKFKIKRGDMVQVTTGKDKGKRGAVLRVFLDCAKVIVENVNVVVRFAKPDYKNPDGPFRKEMPIDISNVALVDPTVGAPGKVGYRTGADGRKERYFKKSGASAPAGFGR